MRSRVLCLLVVTALPLAACGTRSTGSVAPVRGATVTSPAESSARAALRTPAQVMVTENDITDRPYRSLGDVKVTVAKWTIFDADPTREKVNEALQQKAAALGADAVVLARYGTVGVSFMSWGELEGSGRAVAFAK